MPLQSMNIKALALGLNVVLVCECLAQDAAPTRTCEVSKAARAACDVEVRLTEALRRNDAAALAQIYSDDFTLVNFRGTKVNKAGVLEALRAGTLGLCAQKRQLAPRRVADNADSAATVSGL